MLWKCCIQYASGFGKSSSGHRTGKGQFSFQSQRKAMPKNVQATTQLHSSHTLSEEGNGTHSSTLAWKIPWTEEPHGLQSMGCSHEELDTTERLHFHFSLSCIGEGIGNPLWWVWWAAVSGVAQSQTWRKQLSSSSSTRYQSNAENSPSQASTVSEPWTSRCSSCI